MTEHGHRYTSRSAAMNYRVSREKGPNDCFGVFESPGEQLVYDACSVSGKINLRELSTNTQILMTPAEVEAVIEALSLALDRSQANHEPVVVLDVVVLDDGTRLQIH
jgi:hypothetical protein